MEFQDNWVVVMDGTVIDPVLKLLIEQHSAPEMKQNEVDLWGFYDPEIEADRLVVPMSEEERLAATWADIAPGTLVIFESERCDRIFYGLGLHWDEVGDTLRIKATMSDYNFSLDFRSMKKTGYPVISKHPESVILHSLKGFVKVSSFRNQSLDKDYPTAKTVEMCLPTEQAFGLFGLSKASCPEVEPGWVRIASRETG
jgi:hypothetical protein